MKQQLFVDIMSMRDAWKCAETVAVASINLSRCSSCPGNSLLLGGRNFVIRHSTQRISIKGLSENTFDSNAMLIYGYEVKCHSIHNEIARTASGKCS